MAYGTQMLLLFVCWVIVDNSCAAPIPNYDIIPHFELPHVFSGPFIIIVSAGVLVACAVLIFGCTCCEHKNLPEISNQNRRVLGQLNDNLAALQNGSEFAIFPPSSTAINLQPVSLFGNETEKVVFEPLPDILPKHHINGQNLAQSSKPAHFSMLLRRKSSLHDWFDDPNSNFPRNRLQYLQEIGNGWFGRVVEGEAQMIMDGQERTPVIVKILREEATPSEHLYFLHDIRPYRDLQHPNVLRLLGRCLESDPFLLIMEHSTSNLKSFLINEREKKQGPGINEQLLQIICGVTAGLSHMHENNFTHSDLAARNCFIGMNNIVKVGDYGLSLEMFSEDYYCVGDLALPVRWLAPEALNCTERAIETRDTTKESNVWSLGVLFWEILELGALPYSTFTNEDVLQKVILERSVCLEEPKRSHPYKFQLYQIMELCWRPSNYRPDIQIVEMLLRQLSRHKKSSENFSSFERRWNALQNKASLSASNEPRFENDFTASYSEHNASLFSESISDSSCEPFPESAGSCRSPSLRALNGSFDELLTDDIDQLSKSPALEQGGQSKRDIEVVTPEQITEAIRDFDDMLATEAMMLGVDSRSATLERSSTKHEKEPSIERNAIEIISEKDDSDVASVPVLKDVQMLVTDNCSSELKESKYDSKDQVPVQNNDSDAISKIDTSSTPSNYKSFSVNEPSTPLPDILITQSSHCQNYDDELESEDQFIDVNIFKPTKNYHFVFKDDLERNSDVNSSERIESVPPDIIETCECSTEDVSRSYSSDPVTSTPSKSLEFYSLVIDDSFTSSKTPREMGLDDLVTASNESRSYYESVTTISSNEENSVSFKTAATSLHDNEANNNRTVNSSDDSLPKGVQVTDENMTLSENSFFSATSNVRSDVLLSKDHSHSEDYYSTLENSPAFSEKTISIGNDNQRCGTPDMFGAEQTLSADFEIDPISDDSDVNANRLASDQNESAIADQVPSNTPNGEQEGDQHVENETSRLLDALSNLVPFHEDTTRMKMHCHFSELNIAPKSSPVAGHAANDTRNDLVKENLVTSPLDHGSFIFHKPYLDLQEDPELESSSVASDSFIFINNPDESRNDGDDKCGRVLAWNDLNKIIVSDLSDIDEVESENSTPDPRKAAAANGNCDSFSFASSDMNMNFQEYNQRCNFRGPTEMPLNCIDEYDDDDEEDDDQIEADEVLKIDTETNEAILVDGSESLIGFVPSRSIELLQEYDRLASRLDTIDNLRNTYASSDVSDDEAVDVSTHMCNGFTVKNDGTDLSPFLENTECSDDELLKSECDKTESTGEENDLSPVKQISRPLPETDNNGINTVHYECPLNQNNDTENIIKCNDENDNVSDIYNDVVISNQPTKSVIWHSDETLDVLKDDEDNIGPVIIEGEEILAGYNNKNDSLNSQIQFGSSDFLDRLIVSASSSPNCSAASTPCRDVVYTPDFESESEDSTSSCSSTSGSFECIHNKFKNVTDISMESVKKEDSPISDKPDDISPLKVFSKTWDCHATPNKSLLKSPEKKQVLPIRKSVSFHEDPQLVFQYPPASDSSDDDGIDNDYLRHIDYTNYADWELRAGDDDDIPEEMIEIEELEYEPCSRGRGYRGISSFSFAGASLYTLTGFSEDDLDTQDMTGPPRFLNDDERIMDFKRPGVINQNDSEVDKVTTNNHVPMDISDKAQNNIINPVSADLESEDINLLSSRSEIGRNHSEAENPRNDDASTDGRCCNPTGHFSESFNHSVNSNVIEHDEVINDHSEKLSIDDTDFASGHDSDNVLFWEATGSNHLPDIPEVSLESLSSDEVSQCLQEINESSVLGNMHDSALENTEYHETSKSVMDCADFITNGDDHDALHEDVSTNPSNDDSVDVNYYYDDDEVPKKLAASVSTELKENDASFIDVEKSIHDFSVPKDSLKLMKNVHLKRKNNLSAMNGNTNDKSSVDSSLTTETSKTINSLEANIVYSDSAIETIRSVDSDKNETSVTLSKTCDVSVTNDDHINVEMDKNICITPIDCHNADKTKTGMSAETTSINNIDDVTPGPDHVIKPNENALPGAGISNDVSSQKYSSITLPSNEATDFKNSLAEDKDCKTNMNCSDAMEKENSKPSVKSLSVPSIIITDADDLSSSDDELREFLQEHLRLYAHGETDMAEEFEVSPDYSDCPFEDTFGYSPVLAKTEDSQCVEAVNFVRKNSEDSSFS